MRLPSTLVSILVLLLTLSGCELVAGDASPATRSEAATAEVLEAEPKETAADGPPISGEESVHYLPVADWLVQRRTVCDQSNSAIDAQLARYRESLKSLPSGENAGVVHAYSQLQALMLASCNPARTPGLLSTFLNSITRYGDWPPEYSALFDLLESEYQAYSLLEEKYQELESRHQRTIDGIGNIERNLESQTETPQ